LNNHENRISNLENPISLKIQEEINRIIPLIQEKRTANSLVLAHISDIHSDNIETNETDDSLAMASQIIQELTKRIPIDGFICHGDVSAASGTYTNNNIKGDF
jgi:hypothetical protein